MKLIDELELIEKSKALPEWEATVAKLTDLILDRARGDYFAAVLVATHSKQVNSLLEKWAIEQGLSIEKTNSGFGTPCLWLLWGYGPLITQGPDAEILSNGTIRIPIRK